MKNQSVGVLFLVEVAIFTALAILLDLLSGFLTGRFWPNGGSVSIGMLPVIIMAFRWGLKGGLLTGLLFGLLQLLGLSGAPSIVHPVQAFAEYFLAFTVVGFAGLFAKQVQSGLKSRTPSKWISYLIIGTVLGSFLRFLCHFYAGIVFWDIYAPEDMPVVLYSFVYNGGYMLMTAIICTAMLLLLMPALPKKYATNLNAA